MRFVDANVFIYALIKSPRKDYLIARGVLKRIEEGEEAITSTAVAQEVVDWLEYNNRKEGREVLNNIELVRKHEEGRNYLG